MPPPGTITSGVVLKVFAADGTTKVYVNVCGHDSVGLPLTKSMEPIPDAAFLDHHGLDNLIIPISVGDAQHHNRTSDLDGGKMIIVDVVVHTQIIKRILPTFPRYADFLPKVSELALDWVTQETGIQLSKRTVKMVPSLSYKDAPARKPKGDANSDDHLSPEERRQLEENIHKRANLLYEQMLKETSASNAAAASGPAMSSSGATLPDQFRLPTPSASKANDAPKAKKLVQEMPATNEPVIRKGFLNNPGTRLYDDKGTTEGVLPEGAGDPLGYLPKGLRDRVQVVDTRPEAQPKPQPKASLPFTIGSPDEVTGAEFLDQLSMIDRVASNRDPNALEQMTQMLQGELMKKKTKSGDDGPTQKEKEAALLAAAVASTGPTVPTAKTSAEVAALVRSSAAAQSVPTTSSGWTETVSVDSAQSPSVITVRLTAPPHIVGMKDVELAAEPEYIDVNDHRVVLPCTLDVDTVKAKFVKSSRTLIVSGNVVS